MPVTAIDTLKYARSLKLAGVSEQHAEAQAIALSDAMQAGVQDLVTKEEFGLFRQEVKAEFALVRQEMKAESVQIRQDLKQMETRLDAKIDKLEARVYGDMTLLKWMSGFCITGILTIIGIAIRVAFVRGV